MLQEQTIYQKIKRKLILYIYIIVQQVNIC